MFTDEILDSVLWTLDCPVSSHLSCHASTINTIYPMDIQRRHMSKVTWQLSQSMALHILHRVSKKVAHHTLQNIFVQGWPIAKISTATESEIICEHKFLADRTNGRAYATVLRLSSSVCNVMYCG